MKDVDKWRLCLECALSIYAQDLQTTDIIQAATQDEVQSVAGEMVTDLDKEDTVGLVNMAAKAL
jgi:hypothetical protein